MGPGLGEDSFFRRRRNDKRTSGIFWDDRLFRHDRNLSLGMSSQPRGLDRIGCREI